MVVDSQLLLPAQASLEGGSAVRHEPVWLPYTDRLHRRMKNLATPRVPAAPLSAALYESHYLTATDPSGGRALWIRHTALKPPGQRPFPTVWLTWFDRSMSPPRAIRVTADDPLSDPGGAWARSRLGELSAKGATGAIEGASWSLAWDAPLAELSYLPARWMYDRTIPRSNGAALMPSASVAHGAVILDGKEPVRLDGWDLTLGHNWGSEHADQWTWIHAGGLEDDRTGWLDFALARVKVGPLLTPWSAGGAVHLRGQTHRTRTLGRVRRELQGESTLVILPLGAGATLELRVTAPENQTVSWDYVSPRGPGRNVRNCSVADASVKLRAARSEQAIELNGRVAVEHGWRSG